MEEELQVALSPTPSIAVTDPDLAWIVGDDQALHVINCATAQEIKKINMGQDFDLCLFTPHPHYMACVNSTYPKVWFIDTIDWQPRGEEIFLSNHQAKSSPLLIGKKYIWALHQESAHHILKGADLVHLKKLKDAILEKEPGNIMITPDDRFILNINIPEQRLNIFHPLSGKRTCPPISLPEGFPLTCFTPDSTYLLLLYPVRSLLTILNLETLDKTTTLQIAPDPLSIQCTPDGKYALILNPFLKITLINLKTRTKEQIIQPFHPFECLEIDKNKGKNQSFPDFHYFSLSSSTPTVMNPLSENQLVSFPTEQEHLLVTYQYLDRFYLTTYLKKEDEEICEIETETTPSSDNKYIVTVYSDRSSIDIFHIQKKSIISFDLKYTPQYITFAPFPFVDPVLMRQQNLLTALKDSRLTDLEVFFSKKGEKNVII